LVKVKTSATVAAVGVAKVNAGVGGVAGVGVGGVGAAVVNVPTLV
jgi:hypothetical protein